MCLKIGQTYLGLWALNLGEKPEAEIQRLYKEVQRMYSEVKIDLSPEEEGIHNDLIYLQKELNSRGLL